MIKLIVLALSLLLSQKVYGSLAGGRPNAFSEGQNAFAGVVNPANAVWLVDRIDIGAFWVHQKATLNNHDHNPNFIAGKANFSYRANNIFTADAAINKKFTLKIGQSPKECSFSLASYTTPSVVKIRTKIPVPASGTTPTAISNKTEVISAIFSIKLNSAHSVGISLEYIHLSHLRRGFQNSDNPQRSVSPGHVTNNGTDHSHGIGMTIGWRWKITKSLNFGAAWAKKNSCGRYRKYRGFEPHHAKNATPQTFGAGFSYRFNTKLAGRLEVLWSNLGDLPGSNNNVLPDGSLNLHKRGSNKSPGPGLQDATYINIGMGYMINPMLSIGAGLSHRIKLQRKTSNMLSRTYMFQTIYDVASLAANLNTEKYNLFIGITYGLKNKVKGYMPEIVGGGKFTSEKNNYSASISCGYFY